VDERLRTAEYLCPAEADEELLGPVEAAHAHGPRPYALEDVRVRARAHGQVVLPSEPERLVVERLAEQARVVDLEYVDVDQVSVKRPRVGNRVEPVEGVGEVDEATLRLDRGDRLRE